MTLTARTQRLATRNWISGTDTNQTVIDGEQITLPDVSWRATSHPQALEQFIPTFTASARFALRHQRSAVPSVSTLLPADIRTSRVLSYPLGANVVWNDAGGLTTGFSVGSSYRVDSLPR